MTNGIFVSTLHKIVSGHHHFANVLFNYIKPLLRLTHTLTGGLNKDDDPVPIVLRTGDVLFMGGKSRLRVHGVSNVFTYLQPPACLHPSTAGEECIHKPGCPWFLKDPGVASSAPAASPSSSSSVPTSSNTISSQQSQGSPNGSPPEVLPKRRRISAGDDDDMRTSSAECSGKDAGESTTDVTVHGAGGVSLSGCTCGGVPADEIRRALRFLQTTRVNINVRQVNPDCSVRKI
jgi:hypothetical protein